MRALRYLAEPAAAGMGTLRAVPPRPARSRRRRPNWWPGGVAAAVLHGLVLALLLIGLPPQQPVEQQNSPSFAVQFTNPGLTAASPPAPASQPQVNLGVPDMAVPPQPDERATEPSPVPRPMRRYGAALRPKADRNPFAHVTPFDLSPSQPRSQASNFNGRSLDLSAGPIVRNGRLTDAVTHVRGSHGVPDYMDELRDFVEAHKYYPQGAVERGEEGAAALQVTIQRDGTVTGLRLLSSSGSPLLDSAWMSVFRDNKLPPFNDDMPMQQLTLPVTLDYHLIYSH